MTTSMIQLDKQLVDGLVKEHLNAAVLTVLADQKEGLLRAMSDRILNLKVDSNGNVNSYERENKYSWVEHTLNIELRSAIKKAVVDQLTAMKPEIEKAVKKEVAKSGSAIAKAIMGGFTEALKVDYKFTVNLSAERD